MIRSRVSLEAPKRLPITEKWVSFSFLMIPTFFPLAFHVMLSFTIIVFISVLDTIGIQSRKVL
jgi:hypothetical protein